VSSGIDVLASQASRLRKLFCKLRFLDDAFVPHRCGSDRTNLGYCVLHGAKGQQMAHALRRFFPQIDGRRGANWDRARRDSTLLFRDGKLHLLRIVD
jgi:hypothetical protein